MSITHLVIPDAHAKDSESNERFSWLGNFIIENQPDKIICLGDFLDMYSLNGYDKGKRSFEGARYAYDIRAGNDALSKVMKPVIEHNNKSTKHKKKKYNPEIKITLGNHEARIDKATQDNAQLHGIISIDDVHFKRYGWEVYPYLTKIVVDGVVYVHCVQTANSAMMMGGKHHANSLLVQEHVSITVGHSHKLDYKTDTTGYGNRIHGLVAGCYFEHHEGYAHQSNENWWRGVVLKRGVKNGEYSPQFITIEDIKKDYG